MSEEGNNEVMVMEDEFPQDHEELVYEETWWWAVHICLCAIAVVANLIFIITVIHNRYAHNACLSHLSFSAGVLSDLS